MSYMFSKLEAHPVPQSKNYIVRLLFKSVVFKLSPPAIYQAASARL